MIRRQTLHTWPEHDRPAIAEAEDEKQLAELVHGFAAGTDTLGLARRLVDYARDRRGHDNITVALLALGEQR